MDDVTHREIYERLARVETKVDTIDQKTTDVVTAFEAARGAFIVLDWIGKVAKPILWMIGFGAIVVTAYEKFKSQF